MFGKIFTQYRSWATGIPSTIQESACNAVMHSLESRWASSDQDLFIVTTILNPYIGRRRLCFNPSVKAWQKNGLYHTIRRVYGRVLSEEPPPDLYEEWIDYKTCNKGFSDEALALDPHRWIAERKNESPCPIGVWRAVEPQGYLSRLALHLLQIVPNSAAVERMFSLWKDLDSLKGNRRHYQKTGDIVRVRADINVEHQSRNRKRTLGSDKYKGDMALSSRLQTANIDEDNDNLDSPELVDWDLSNRSWFQEISDDIDMENVPINNVPAEKITLSELYDAESDISILFPTRSTWVIGMAQMEDEIEY